MRHKRPTNQLSLLGAAQSSRRRTRAVPSDRKRVIRLSPTTGLNLFVECPRCFYMHYSHRVTRPRGIFPSLPSGMDLVIKGYFDQYRGTLPPELLGKVEGVLFDELPLLTKWRNWRTGLEYVDRRKNAVLFGALDDCLTLDGTYIPLDYKTKGSAPNDGDSERYYQLQLDTYALLLKANGYQPARFAYLVYYFPLRVEQGGVVTFRVHPVRIQADPSRAQKTFEAAVKLLRGTIPDRHTRCEYCLWNSRLQEFD